MSEDPIIVALARLEVRQAALRDHLAPMRTAFMDRIDRAQHSSDRIERPAVWTQVDKALTTWERAAVQRMISAQIALGIVHGDFDFPQT